MKIVISDHELTKSHHDARITEILDTIEQACKKLEILGHIQVTSSSLAMESAGRDTFECRARLKNHLANLRRGK